MPGARVGGFTQLQFLRTTMTDNEDLFHMVLEAVVSTACMYLAPGTAALQDHTKKRPPCPKSAASFVESSEGHCP